MSDEKAKLKKKVQDKINEFGAVLDELKKQDGVDQRALALSATHAQDASMWAVRGIFNPDDFAG